MYHLLNKAGCYYHSLLLPKGSSGQEGPPAPSPKVSVLTTIQRRFPSGQAGLMRPHWPPSSPGPTSSSRLHAASRCSSSLRLRVQSLVTLRMSSLRAWLAELAWSSCSRSIAFTWARLALLGGTKRDQWAHAGEDHPASHDPSLLLPPLLLLLQADEGTLQVSAVLCVLSGRSGASGWARGGKGLPCPTLAPTLSRCCSSSVDLSRSCCSRSEHFFLYWRIWRWVTNS